MNNEIKTRAYSFLQIVSWVYLVLSAALVGLALYGLTNANVNLTFGGVLDSVFAIIGGVLGFVAGIFGLVSKNLKRCRLLGLALLLIAAVPLVINLLAGQTISVYWKNIVMMVLPLMYLIAALIKRSEKKPPKAEEESEEAPIKPVQTQPEKTE